MKDSVIINGVTLTRTQVEQALKELNALPKPIPTGQLYVRQASLGNTGGVAFASLDPDKLENMLVAFRKDAAMWPHGPRTCGIVITLENGRVALTSNLSTQAQQTEELFRPVAVEVK